MSTRLLKDILSIEPANVSTPSFIYQSTGIGAILSFIITSALLIHIIYNYVNFFHRHKKSKTSSQQNKTIYILFIIRLMMTLLVCILFLCFKSNYLSHWNTDQYSNKSMLYLIYYGSGALVQMSGNVTFILYIYRIQIIFRDTVYEYHKYIFYTLYSLILFQYFTVSGLLYGAHSNTNFVIYHLGDIEKNQLYIKLSEESNYDPITLVSSVVLVIGIIGFSLVSLYMFTKKLIKLKRVLIEQYASELSGLSRATSGSISRSPSSDGSIQSTEHEYSITTTTKVTMSQIKQHKKKGNAADRIYKLHALIKRHTILVWISVVGTLVFFVAYTVISTWLFSQMPFLFSLSNITLWLMFGCCDDYWKWCKRYFCCFICYRCRKGTSQICFCFKSPTQSKSENMDTSEYKSRDSHDKTVTMIEKSMTSTCNLKPGNNGKKAVLVHEPTLDTEHREDSIKEYDDEQSKEENDPKIVIVVTPNTDDERDERDEKEEKEKRDENNDEMEMAFYHTYQGSTRL